MKPPFSVAKLDALMEQAGIDVLLATSKENVQHLLGGYECFFFAHKNTIGVSRYVPCLGYVKGQPEKAFYVGSPLENNQQALEPGFWVKNVRNNSWQSEKTGRETAEFLRKLGFANRTVGVESSFLPADCFSTLQAELPSVKFIEAHPVLDELRAVKRPDELAFLKEASELIIDLREAIQKTQQYLKTVPSERNIVPSRKLRQEGRANERMCTPCATPAPKWCNSIF